MARRRRQWGLILAVLALLFSVAAFYGSTSAAPLAAQGYGGYGAPNAPSAPAPTFTLSVTTPSGGSKYLTDSNGKPQYTYSSDVAGSGTLTCTGGCANAWPPLKVQAGQTPSLDPSATGTIGTIPQPDGSAVVTYNGLPLYGFVGDQPGAAPTGNNSTVGGGTFVLAAP
jgi:predicted lipoprotein with Yx(FWY)xxD motif